MTTIVIPKIIEKELKLTSQKFGLSKEDFLLNAFSFYLQNLEKKMNLEKELELWKKASDFDLIKFEQNL